MVISVNSYAVELKQDLPIPVYWICIPEVADIDYSYLRDDNWEPKNISNTNNFQPQASKVDSYRYQPKWGLVNCVK